MGSLLQNSGVAELRSCGLRSCGSWAPGCAVSGVVVPGLCCPMACEILVPDQGWNSPALEGRFLTTEPPGKFLSSLLFPFTNCSLEI